MANLRLSHIYKVYDNGHKAVNDFNIDIKDKEFIVFVGPSGCGKSTTLRMIAGLEAITAGDLFIEDTLVNDMEPKDRDIAMVFQNYALYPHMTVYENMAFGLKNRHVSKEVIHEKVMEAAKILDIEDYLDRKPKAMSGGQRQRVALGRAIVRDPKVFLLDEPLSNLDAKLRAQMRTEITKLHKKLATTFIYVTHDQVEAMTMGTRIVVMKLGYVQQIDTPMNLYNEPYNKFVAGFIGSPQMNFFDVTLNRVGEVVNMEFIDGSKIKLPFEKVSKVHDSYIHGDVKVTLGIRPEHIKLSHKATGLKCLVSAVEHLGNESIIYGEIGLGSDDFTLKDVGKNITIKTVESASVQVGDIVDLAIDHDKIHFFDKETEITLISAIPDFTPVQAKVENKDMVVLDKKVVLPPAFVEALGERKEFMMEISPYAIVPGKDFHLKVHEVEEVEGQHLAYLEYGDRYLFALVDENVKLGDDYHFAILNDKVEIVVDEEALLAPVKKQEMLYGFFGKKEVKENGERVLNFFYNIESIHVPAPQNNGFKINAIEGNDAYKKKYHYIFDRKAIHIVSEGGIPAKVERTIDYGNQKYALLDINAQKLLIEVEPKFAETSVNVWIDGENIEVWQAEVDMRLCQYRSVNEKMDRNIRLLFYNIDMQRTNDPAEDSKIISQTSIENIKPHFMQRLGGGLIDICIIFFFFWLCYFGCMNTPIANTYNQYKHQIVEIQDMTKLETGYGEKVLINESNVDEYQNYQTYVDEVEQTYIVKNIPDATQEIYDEYIQSLQDNSVYKNLTFDKDLIHYGISVLCGTVSLSIFLLAVPLLNKRRATIGQLFTEQQLISTRYQSRARWYQVVFRFLFILIIEGCLPFLFFSLNAFYIMPIVFLLIASLTKSGRTLHDLVTGTKVIDKKSFVPLVSEE